MRRIHRLVLLGCFKIFSLCLLAAQDAGKGSPEAPEVLLPTMILEAEGREEFTFPLPLFAEPMLDIPPVFLQTELRLTLPPDFLAVSLDLPPTAPRPRDRASLYTEGTLGLGTMAGLLGQFALFQRGEGSKVDVKFSHQSRDGYQFKVAGKGFFDRQDQIYGRGEFSLGQNTRLTFEGNIEQWEKGLQGISASYSNAYRFVEGDFTLSHYLAETIELYSQSSVNYADRLLTGASPHKQTELVGNTRLGIRVEDEVFTFSTEGHFNIGTYTDLDPDSYWTGGGKITGEWNVNPWVFIEGGVGLWRQERLEIPFHGNFSIKPTEDILLTATATYDVHTLTYGSVWKQMVPILQTETPFHGRSLTFGVTGQLKGEGNLLVLSAGVEGKRRWGVLNLNPYDTIEEGFTVERNTLLTYTFQLEGSYLLFPEIQGTLQWNWILGDRAFLEKEHTLQGSLRWAPEKHPFGGVITSAWHSGEGNALPVISIEGYFRPRENLEFSLSFVDLMAPFMEEGRISVPPFIDPGFRGMLKTTVLF